MRELRAIDVDPPRWNPASATGSVLLRGGRARRGAGGPGTLAALARFLRRVGRGRVVSVVALELDGAAAITAVRIVVNPRKLTPGVIPPSPGATSSRSRPSA